MPASIVINAENNAQKTIKQLREKIDFLEHENQLLYKKLQAYEKAASHVRSEEADK